MFADRADGGRRLAQRLQHLRGKNLTVLGLPRGGVPVAYEVAKTLGTPLDVILVRKLGVPYQPELAMGAVGEDGIRVIDQEILALARISAEELDQLEKRELAELKRRSRSLRGARHRASLSGRIALIVDDGIATGSTIRAAAKVAHTLGASRVILAAPVAPPGMQERLLGVADEVVILEAPEPFFAVGQFYADFSQTPDSEVRTLLQRGSQTPTGKTPEEAPSFSDPPVFDAEIRVHAGRHRLPGWLTIPENSKGTVVFVHGSGSSHHSPRNRQVATELNRGGMGTLLFDLLTPDEETLRSHVFDIDLLASRLVLATQWLTKFQSWSPQPLGYFGASTGAAAALWAASELGDDISAIVSRGGRPDLAALRLSEVSSPTLFIVGGLDRLVLDLNRAAQAELTCESRLEVLPEAGHLFEEPGAMDDVAQLAQQWFITHFATAEARSSVTRWSTRRGTPPPTTSAWRDRHY